MTQQLGSFVVIVSVVAITAAVWFDDLQYCFSF